MHDETCCPEAVTCAGIAAGVAAVLLWFGPLESLPWARVARAIRNAPVLVRTNSP